MELTTSNPSNFVFPVLKNSDILQCMAELDVELNKTELLEPQRHKDRVRKVFVAIVSILPVGHGGSSLFTYVLLTLNACCAMCLSIVVSMIFVLCLCFCYSCATAMDSWRFVVV